MEDYGYTVAKVAATEVAPDDIDKTFRSSSIDLVSAALGGRIVAFSDQWFADAANLLTPTPPVRQAGKMVFTGAWYDGWETRRHNAAPFDWVIVRLGVAAGIVVGIEVDTAFFSGNHAPAISVEGCSAESDDEVASWGAGGGAGGGGEGGEGGSGSGWEVILDIRECGPSRRFAWRLDAATSRSYTHVRLNMYPDGGIARFRLFGRAVPVFGADAAELLDLAAAQNGAVAVACSDQHFGAKDNLLLPGRGKDMGDGWETARSRARSHIDWAIVRLGAAGRAHRVVVDTAHFRGNYPQKVRVEAIRWRAPAEPGHGTEGWSTLVPDSPCGPDQEHIFEVGGGGGDDGEQRTDNDEGVITHVKLVMVPDGGVKRLRVWGTRAV